MPCCIIRKSAMFDSSQTLPVVRYKVVLELVIWGKWSRRYAARPFRPNNKLSNHFISRNGQSLTAILHEKEKLDRS